MPKLDMKKEWKHLYSPSTKEPAIIEVPTFNFLMIDGTGDPNTAQEYKDAVSALYSLAYAIKFAVKKAQGIDFAVMPLQGLWWVEDMRLFSTTPKDDWSWTMMILQPDLVTAALVEEQRAVARQKKDLPAIDALRFEPYHEGTCVQLMHLGPYADEGPNIARMHQYAFEQGYQLDGKHHEIYLSDPSRTAPERLKTILRQPISR